MSKVEEYWLLLNNLLDAREASKRDLTDDEEDDPWGDALDAVWYSMTPEEQQTADNMANFDRIRKGTT